MRTLVLTVTFAIAVAACGSSKHSTAPSKNGSSTTVARPAGAPNVAACSLVPQADATQLFGHPAQLVASPGATSALSTCVWQADTNPDPNSLDNVEYRLQVHIYPTSNFYMEKYVKGAKHLSGIGTRAFDSTQGSLAQLAFMKYGRTVTLDYGIEAITANPKPKASDQLDALVAIARAAASRY
jgi:hypothetical protein